MFLMSNIIPAIQVLEFFGAGMIGTILIIIGALYGLWLLTLKVTRFCLKKTLKK